jgi:hypothetical protein
MTLMLSQLHSLRRVPKSNLDHFEGDVLLQSLNCFVNLRLESFFFISILTACAVIVAKRTRSTSVVGPRSINNTSVKQSILQIYSMSKLRMYSIDSQAVSCAQDVFNNINANIKVSYF